MKVRVDAEQGVPRVQVRQKPWVLAETLRESGPVLPDAMGRQVAAWDRRRGAGPGQEGQGGSTAPGRSGRGAGAQPHVSVTSLDCLPQTLDFPRLDDHRRKLSQSSPSLLPARNGTRSSHQASETVQLLAAWSLSGPPSVPWRLLPTSGLLWPWAHLPALNLQDPGSPQGVPHRSVPTPAPREIFRLSRGSELNTGPQSTLSGGGFPLQKKGLGLGPAQEPATLSHKPSKARGPQRPFLPH